MPRRCVIINCLTKGSVRNKSMYKFPKDEELCKKWLEVIKNPKLDKIYETNGVYALNKRVFVCSDHFEAKWLRDVNEPSQGLFLGAIPSVSLNLSMDALLTNLRKCEMYKEYGHPKKMFQRHVFKNTNEIKTPMGHQPGNSNLTNLDAPNREIMFPVSHNMGNAKLRNNMNAPLDKLTVKDDEELLSLIEKRRMNINIEPPPKKVEVKKKKDESTTTPVKIKKTKVKKVVPKKSKVKKLKLRVKGTEKFINVVVTPKTAEGNLTNVPAQPSQNTIKIFVPKKQLEGKGPRSQNKSIKVVVPNSINGEEVQLDRSEISKIINLVSGPRVLGKKRVKLEAKNQSAKEATTENNTLENNECLNEKSNRKLKSATSKKSLAKTLKNRQMLKKVSPIKSVYKKTSEANKTMRDFIESYFGEMIKCSCDFTPQENIMNISQRIIELKKKLVNAQKLLSKHKANNKKIAATIDELRKQIPEKPVKPPQKGQLIKCIMPRTKITDEKYRRGKHRFTKTLKTFALDLFYSSPLSYSILEKIYLLPSRKTLKRWLVHPQNNTPEFMSSTNEFMPEEHNHEISHESHMNSMHHGNMEVMHNVMEPIIRHHHHQEMMQHNINMGHSTMAHHHNMETHMGTIEDNIEPLQENIDDIMFRNDLAEAIMNS